MMRIALFLITNLAVITIFGFILNLAGIQSNDINRLLILALLIGFSGSLISLLLSKWIAMRSVDGALIKEPNNDTEHWLIDTVNKQAKQAGITVPDIAVYHSPDINAFATGARRDASLIAVSTGLLKNMSRNEAEAVVAHEICHIANGDMVTMTLIQGVVNTFVIFISRAVAQITASLFSNKYDNEIEENNKDSFIYFLSAMILELVFGIIANIVTMWFSRYREFHADAGSAKLVGSEKMIAALQRLKTSCEPNEQSEIISFCINGKTQYLSELFMTHPPLDKRIEALRFKKYMK